MFTKFRQFVQKITFFTLFLVLGLFFLFVTAPVLLIKMEVSEINRKLDTVLGMQDSVDAMQDDLSNIKEKSNKSILLKF